MPIRSEAQAGWLQANRPDLYKKWLAETPPGKLPARVGPPKKSKAPAKKVSPSKGHW